MATGEVAPSTLTFLRWSVMCVVVLPFAWRHLKRDWASIRAHWFKLASYGALGFAGFNLFLYGGLQYTTAVNGSLIQATIPFIILGVNWLLFAEPMRSVQLIGLLLAFTGIILIITAGAPLALLDLVPNRGDMMILIGSVLYAIYSVALRAKPHISWLSFICASGVSATLISAPFAAYELATLPQTFSFSPTAVALVAYAAIFAALIAQIAYAAGVHAIGANRAGIAAQLVPVFGTALGVIILREPLHPYHLLALLLVLGGIALSEYSAFSRSK